MSRLSLGNSLKWNFDPFAKQTYLISKYLSSLLKPHVEKTDAYVKNSPTLIPDLDSLILTASDLLVSLDLVSLYTNIPIQQTLE